MPSLTEQASQPSLYFASYKTQFNPEATEPFEMSSASEADMGSSVIQEMMNLPPLFCFLIFILEMLSVYGRRDADPALQQMGQAQEQAVFFNSGLSEGRH